MAFLDLKIHAVGESFHLAIKHLKSLVYALKAIVHGVMKVSKLTFGGAGQYVDLFSDRFYEISKAVEAVSINSLVIFGDENKSRIIEYRDQKMGENPSNTMSRLRGTKVEGQL